MPRLFIALGIPEEVADRLICLQPRPSDGLRLVGKNQIHLTLHFIGEAEVEPIIAALKTVVCPPVSLIIGGLGQFPPRGRATVLWAGVRGDAHRELQRLYSAIGDALQSIGITLEERPYHPHLTLARCGKSVPTAIIDQYLAQDDRSAHAEVRVTSFGLYSTIMTADGPDYRCERIFPLSGDASTE